MTFYKNRVCKSCGCVGGNYRSRKDKLKNGKIVHYPYSICNLCEREDKMDEYHENRKNKKYVERRKSISKRSYDKHRERRLEEARIYRNKNRHAINEKRRLEYKYGKDYDKNPYLLECI